MFKKFTAVILSLVMLFSAVGVLALDNTTYTDNFEQYDITADTEYASDAFTSDVFKLYGTKGTVLVNGGKDNSKALKVKRSGAADIAIMSKLSHGNGTTEIGELSFDLKAGYNTSNELVEIGNRTQYSGNYPVFILGYDAEKQLGTFKDKDGNVLATYSSDEWYRVVIKYVTGGVKTGYIYDESGVLIATATNTRSYVGPMPAINMKAGASMEVIVDNAMIKHYDKNNAPSLIAGESSVKDNDEGVLRNQTLSFVFDQEISAGSTVSISREDGEEITEITSLTTTKRYTDTLVLSYEGLLDRNTTYIISFSDVTNGTKSCASTDISFTTEDLHIWHDMIVSSVTENNEDKSLTDVTFTIGDEYGYSAFTGSVMAIVYQEGKMIKADIKPLVNVPTGELTESFALGTLPSEYDIGIILLDLVSGPIPLAGGTLEN